MKSETTVLVQYPSVILIYRIQIHRITLYCSLKRVILIKSNAMKKTLILFLFLLTANAIYCQSSNENLNRQLQEMRKYFLEEDYTSFANYTYPKVIEMMGGKARMIQATESSMNQMKAQGFEFIDLSFKDATGLLKQEDETQCSLTQVLTMKTPEGEVKAEYKLIAISADDGKNWKFLDTSGKSKEIMLKYFPNLSPELVIK